MAHFVADIPITSEEVKYEIDCLESEIESIRKRLSDALTDVAARRYKMNHLEAIITKNQNKD